MSGLLSCQTLFLSEENKDEVKLELLDEMALCQMQKIKVRDVGTLRYDVQVHHRKFEFFLFFFFLSVI